MSRSSHQRQQQQLLAQQQQQMADNDAAAAAAEMFDMFCLATTMRQILGLHRNMCDTVGLRPAPLNEFYPKLKAKIRSWKAQALWKKFDARASHRAYSKGNACTGTRVLVIGAGPCGLRTAIEAQLLGAKVVVLEKRDRISRNNVLHLWPFVITDLRNLGAKKFYGKFCAGSIDHISIRQIQCILLKVALLLGVEIHEGVSFESTIEPSEGCGWRAAISPADHAVSHYEFDILIGADGKRNTLEAFKRKEFRGKLAIAITANFINKKTEAEAKAEEISGVAFIFNQTFFKELYHTTGIDLENIVYYKDETHYFVMTAKKHSLIDKGVILQDFADPAELLAPPNVNTEKLLDYAREAAEFSTKYQMPNLEFAVNHYGKPDVAMFDFTSMFAAESSCRVIVRKNYRLMQCLVGDSLLEPFWPTGSGCARGFLSSMDAAYAIKLWNNPRNSILGVVAQRESIYRLLAQTTPENLQRDIGSYTVDPATRYPNLNRTSVNVWQVKHLIDCDDKAVLEQTFMDTNALQASQAETPVRRKRRTGDTLPLSAVLLRWIKAQLHSYEFSQNLNEVSDCFTSGKVLCALINRYRPDLVDFHSVKDLPASDSNELAFKILDKELKISRVMTGKDSIELDKVDSKIWLNYLEQICEVFRGEIPAMKHPKLDVSELREKRNNAPDFSKLLQISSRKAKSPMQDVADLPHTVQRRSVLDEEKVKRQRKHEPGQAQAETPRRAKKRRSAEKTTNIDRERGILSALPRGADEQFSDRIKSMEQRITSRNAYGTDKKPKDLLRAIGKIDSTDWNVREIEKKIEQSKKTETGSKGREKVPKWSKEQFVARQSKMSKPTRQDSREEEKFKEIDQTLKNLDKQLKEGSVLEVGERGKNKVASIAGQFVKKDDTSEEKNPPPIAKSNSKVALAFKKQAASEKCHFCKQTVYLMEKISTEGLILHRSCLKCHHCHTNLRLGGYAFDRDDPDGRFYCTQHFRLPAKAIRPVVRKPGQRKSTAHGSHAPGGLDPKTPEKPRGIAENIVQLDLLDRGQTPERIEFENTDAMSDGEPSEEHIIDENEWSGRNFLQPSADSESDLSSSSDESDDDSESDIFEEANGSPIAQQTLQLATDWIGKQHYSNVNSDDSDDDFYDSSEGLIDDGKDDTEGEDIKKAREMRREEVRLLPLPTNLPTDTETEKQTQVVGSPGDGVTEQKIDDTISSERLNRDADKLSLASRASDSSATPSKADIEKIEQNSDRRFSADVDAISEKLYRLNNLMKMSKDIESMAKENLVKSDILKKLSLKEKWLLDNSVAKVPTAPSFVGFSGDKGPTTKAGESPLLKDIGEPNGALSEKIVPVPNGDDDRGDGLQVKASEEGNSSEFEAVDVIPEGVQKENVPHVASGEAEPSKDDLKNDGFTEIQPTNNEQEENVPEVTSGGDHPAVDDEKESVSKMSTDKMEIEGILDIVKMMDISFIEQSKEPLPQPHSSPKASAKDVGKMLYEAEHKNDNSLNDALRQIEVKNFAGTMDTIKSQMVTPKISHQGSLDISKYFPNAKEEKQSSAAVNKTQKTLKDVDLTKYFPPSPVAQRKASVTTIADRLKKSQTEATVAAATEPPKAPPRRQKSMAASSSSTDKAFSIHEHLLDGAIDIQKAPVVKAVPKKGGIRIVKKIVPKGTKAKKSAPVVEKKPQDESDKILDEILQSGQEVRSPSIEYQKLFTEEKSPSEDISDRIDRILEETGIDLGLPPKPKKKLLKTKSLGEEEFKRTQEDMLSKEDGDRPTGVQKLLQRFESMSSIKSDESSKLKKTSFSSTCSSLNKSKESLRSRESLKSNSDSLSDLEKTMEYLKSEWKTEATNFLQKKRDTFYANRDLKQAEAEAEAKKQALPEPPQYKHTKYSKFFGIKEKSPEKRKSPSIKRKSPAKVLKKSPREEIMKHRKKVESVSSRRASFEEKIKAEEARLKTVDVAKQSGLENGLKSTDSGEVNTNGVSKIPIRQDRNDSAELKGNHLDTAQKVLSRRASGTSGLADILKPPVVKGVRGQPKVENATPQPEDTPKVEENSELKESQNCLHNKNNTETGVESRSSSQVEPSLTAPLSQTKIPSKSGSQAETASTESSQKGSSIRGSQIEVVSGESPQTLSSRRESQTEAAPIGSPEMSQSRRASPAKVVSRESPQKLSSRRSSPAEVVSRESPQKVPSRRPSQSGVVSSEAPEKSQSRRQSPAKVVSRESPQKLSSRRPSQSGVVSSGAPEKSQSRRTSPAEVVSRESPQRVPSRRPSQSEILSAGSPEKSQSRRASTAEVVSAESAQKASSRRDSQAEVVSAESPQKVSSKSGSLTKESAQAPAKFPSRRGSQAETETETGKTPPTSSRRSSNFSETLDQTITIDDITDVDEIFNEIVNELDEEEAPPAMAHEVELVAIATDSFEEEPQQVNEEFEKIAMHSRSQSTSTPKRASSEDSIEKLFSQFADDMLVDVEFDSNDEVVAITPRAVLINEDETEKEDDDDEKPITVEQAKLKFEPLFPRQATRLPKSASSSMSISPARADSRTKRIVQKLNPSDMAPSVQDMLQKIIPREHSEPNDRIPMAFPRNIYESDEEGSVSRNQTPDTVEKPEEKATKTGHLNVVYELAWPARQRTPSPVPESARPPIKRLVPSPQKEILEKLSLSRRASETSLKEDGDPRRSNSDIRKASPGLLPTPRRGSRTSADTESTASRRGSKASIKEDERGSPALLPTPRRASRTSIEAHTPKEESPLKVHSLGSPSIEKDSQTSNEPHSEKQSTSPITSRESSHIQRESPAASEVPLATSDTVPQPISKKQQSPSKSDNTINESIPVTQRRDSTSDTSREGSNIDRESPGLPFTAKRTPRASNQQLKSHELATLSAKQSPSTFDTSREGSNIQRESPTLPLTPRRGSKTSTTMETTSVPVSEGESSFPADTYRATPPTPDSPQSARDRFLSQNYPKETSVDMDASKIPYSVRNSKEKAIEKHEPSREYKDFLHSKLESPSVDRRSRHSSRSKERSLEWDMEQLPPSPMPRRKFVDMLPHTSDKEDSHAPSNNPLPSPLSPLAKNVANTETYGTKSPSPAKAAQNIPLSTKRLEEWEIIEQLERERRLALIKRDENYTHQVQEASSGNGQPNNTSRQTVPMVNRLISLDEPQSSKLIEYIKQQTLTDTTKKNEGSPRPRTPQLSRKASNDDLQKQVENLLKSDSPKLAARSRKPEATEATYEDFARFTRKSVDKEATEADEPDLHDSSTASISHNRLSYRQRSPESTTGTYSPTSSMSKSVEHLAPSRPHRSKLTGTMLPDSKVDRETKYLMDRSKHLHNMKRDFMEEKIAGNNPYLKKVIEAQKISREPEYNVDDDDDDEVDYTLDRYRPKNHTTPRFPTSNAIAGRRRRETTRYPDYSSTATDYSRRPYSPHFSTASTSGSRHFVDHFKRSPPSSSRYKVRESSKDSCVIS